MNYLNDVLIPPIIEIINEYNKTSIEDMKTISNYDTIQPYYYGSSEIIRYMNLETNNGIFCDTCMFDLLDAKIEKCWYSKSFDDDEYQCVFHTQIYKNCNGYYVYVSGSSSKSYKEWNHWEYFDVKYSKNQFHFWDKIIPQKMKDYINANSHNPLLQHKHCMSFGKYYEVNLYDNNIMNIYAIFQLSKEKEIVKTVSLENEKVNNIIECLEEGKSKIPFRQCITIYGNIRSYNQTKLDSYIYNIITRYL